MPVATAQGKRFTFPEGTTPEQMGEAIDEYFGGSAQPEQEQVLPTSPAIQGEEEKSLFDKAKDFVSGNDRATELTERLPELSEENGLLFGEDGVKVAALAPVIMSTTDPNEIAKILTKNFDNVGVTYNKDAEGNVFPILANNNTGAVAQINRPGLSGFDVLQSLGLMAAYSPAGRAQSIGGAVLKNAATEGALQTAQVSAGGDFNPGEVALAGGLSGGIQAAGEGAIAAKKLLTKADELTPEQQLVRTGKEANIDVLTSDAMPPKTFAGKTAQQLGEKIPLVGTGRPREFQQELRSQAVSRLQEQYGDFSYDAIISSLKAQKNRLKNAAGNVLEKTGASLDEVGEIPLTHTREVIDSVREELSKPGVIKSNTFMADLDELAGALDEAPQTFTMAKENRTLFRDIANGADKAERTQLSSRAKSLLKRVEVALSRDMKNFAREHLTPQEFTKWEKANAVYAEEATKLTRSKLKSVLDKGDVTPESVQRMLFSRNKSELDLLYGSLTPKGRANARSAIVNKMFEDMGKRQSGVTPNALVGEMKKHAGQINTFFKGEERKRILGLQKVLEATKRAQDAAVSTPTGQQLIGVAAGAGTIAEPTIGIAAGATGLITRLYETPFVRDALLKLHSLPPRSARFEQVFRELLAHVQAAAQSTKHETLAQEE